MTSAITNPGHQIVDEHREAAERALEILLDPSLEPIVDMVLTRRDDRYEALAADGRVTFERTESGDFVELAHEGKNPLADQSTDKFVGLDVERAHLHPHRDANSYPFAYAETASSSTRRPPPTSACSTPRPTTGKTRVATSASTARSGSCKRGRP